MREVYANPALRRLTLAQLVSMFGDFLAIFAVFSIVSFRLHGSPAQVSGIMIAYMLPMAFVGPVAGVFIDRWNVKRTMIISDLVRSVLVLALLWTHQIWQIYTVMILLSSISSFFSPAQTIAIRSMVPKEGLMAANAAMMQVLQVTQIFSPGVAALLIRAVGESACFWLDGASFLFSATMVSTVTINRVAPAAAKEVSGLISDFTEAIKFMATHSKLAFAISAMAAGMFAIRCYSALIAVYVRDILHAQTQLFGALSTLVGIGMMIGTALVTKFTRTRSREHTVMIGLFVVAVGILFLALFGNVPLTVVMTLTMGFGVAMIIIPAQALMQGATPMNMLGRVTSSFMSVLSLAQIAGLVLSGSIAQVIGIQKSYLVTSIVLVMLAAAGWRVVEQQKKQPETVSA